MSGIPISKNNGINPTILICSMCGKELNELALVGKCNKIECLHCGKIIYGNKRTPCPACNSTNLKVLEYDVEVPMRMVGGLCEECADKQAAMEKAVSEGGIYFRCTDCGSTGAIKADTALSKAVREEMGIEAPKPCGIEFNKDSCPVCGKE